MTGNTSLLFATFAGHTRACPMSPNSPQMRRRTTSPQSPNLPPNPQAKLASEQHPPPPPNYLLYLSQHRSHYRAHVGPLGHFGNRVPRPRSSPWWPHPHPPISLSQVHDRPPPLPHRRSRQDFTRASASSVRPSARSTSRRVRPTCLPPVRALRSVHGGERCAGSHPLYRTGTQTWMPMPTLMLMLMLMLMSTRTMPILRHYPRPPLLVPYPHRRRHRHLLQRQRLLRDD